MSKNIKKIITKDFYGDNCLVDSVTASKGKERHPQGWVEVYEIDENGIENLHSKSNLVVYQGRETISQRMFNVENVSCPSTRDDIIAWVGVGSGGVNVGDPFNPSPPVATDTDLAVPVQISAIDPTCADLRGGFYYKKPIESVEYEQDTYNNNSWLIAKTTSRISLADSDGEHISEAGLYSSAGGPIPNYAGPFHLFSRVTFPPVVKVNTRQILFIWYLYF